MFQILLPLEAKYFTTRAEESNKSAKRGTMTAAVITWTFCKSHVQIHTTSLPGLQYMVLEE